jgi:hypothetical protein
MSDFEPLFRADLMVVVVVVVVGSKSGEGTFAATIALSLVILLMSLVWWLSSGFRPTVVGGGSGINCDTDTPFSLNVREVDWNVSAGSIILIDGRERQYG